MKDDQTKILSIEQAVALLINMNYVPEGFTLLEMVDAFAEEAEADYENAYSKRITPEEYKLLETRRDAAISRYTLCSALLEQLEYAAAHPEASALAFSIDDGAPAISLDTLCDWAADTYGIGLTTSTRPDPDFPEANRRWENIEVKILSDHRLSCSSANSKALTKTFEVLGLLNKRTRQPNHQAAILIGLSQKRQFPKDLGKGPRPKDKTAISKLRNALTKLTGVSTDPFHPFKPGDGWKPKFKLIDARRRADERAAREAVHVPYDDARPYEQEDDPAGQWLKDRE